MRAAIARRMSQSKREAPHFYVSAEFGMGNVVAFLSDIARRENGSTPLTVTAVLLKACAVALRSHRRLNAVWQEGEPVGAEHVNLGVAISLEDGLIAPALIRADELSLVELGEALSDLVARTRAGRLRPDEISEATFTLTNLGMFDVTSFTAIINPPQVAILAVGRTVERLRVFDGEPRVTPVLTATLSADHRAVDGADAARFLETMKALLDSPQSLDEPATKEAIR